MTDERMGPPLETEEAGARAKELDAFRLDLLEKRNRAIKARTSIEARWLEDLRVYGRDQATLDGRMTVLEAAVGETPVKGNTEQAQGRSTLYINIIRSKTNAAEARLQDLLFPVDDRNWGIKPTPVPELAEETKNDKTGIVLEGRPVMTEDPTTGEQRQLTSADLAEGELQVAQQKCKRMQDEIDDLLTECSYNGEGRKVIHDAAVLGVGILKGPMVVGTTKKVWLETPQGFEMKIVEELKPASVRVDPWNFYPAEDCGEDPHDGSHIFERKYLSPKKARDLKKLEGVDLEALKRAIRTGPKRVASEAIADGTTRMEAGYSLADANYFELWIYTGDATAEELAMCGCDVPGMEEEDFDPLESYSCNVWVLNDEIIKATLNVLDSGEYPYDVFVWERIEGSWAGQGVPRLAQASNRMLTAAIRSMMENAGQTVGPQIVMNRKHIEPADGDETIRGRKLWYSTSPDMQDVRAAFALFEIPSHQVEYQAIVQMALKFIDDESNFPMLAQGEKGTAPDTVGGMQLLMNSANVVLRRLVKQWDDRITRPHITRYYDWLMQYSDKDELKGDMSVDARGSGALLERDQQNQYILQAMGLVAHPIFGPMLKPMELLKMAFQAMKLPAADAIKTQTEYEADAKRRAEQAGQMAPQDQAKVMVAKLNSDTQKEVTAATIEARLKEVFAEIAASQAESLNKIKAELAGMVIQQRAESDRYNREEALKLQTGEGI